MFNTYGGGLIYQNMRIFQTLCKIFSPWIMLFSNTLFLLGFPGDSWLSNFHFCIILL